MELFGARLPHRLEDEIAARLRDLRGLPGVTQLAEPHFWSQSKDRVIGTISVRCARGIDTQGVVVQAHRILRQCSSLNGLTVEVSEEEAFY